MNRQSKGWRLLRFISFKTQSKSIAADGETIPITAELKPSTANGLLDPNCGDDQPDEREQLDLDRLDDDDLSTYKYYMLNLIYEKENAKLKLCLKKLMQVIKKNLSEAENRDDTVESVFKQLIGKGGEYDEIPMFSAVETNNIEAIKLLLEYGAEVDVRNSIRNTPLSMAAWGNKLRKKKSSDIVHCENELKSDNDCDASDEAVVEYLLSCNADPNAQDEGEQAPLHNGALRGNAATVAALLRSKDIKVDIHDADKQTPLHIACNLDHADVSELLIQANASTTLKDKWGNTSLHYASKCGNCGVIKLLLQTFHNQDDICDFINQKNNEGDTPLLLAVDNNRIDAVQLLTSQGADVHIKQENLNTTLHLAASKGSTQILNLLLQNGSNVDVKNANLETPLHLACSKNKLETVQFLLTKNADIEAKDKLRQTPLLTCFQAEPDEDNLKIIQTLIDHGSNVFATDRMENTAVILGCKTNNVPALEFLLNLSKCKELVNRENRKNNTPLHAAAVAANFEAFECLTKFGATLDSKNDDELTPLHFAIVRGEFNIVQLILQQDNRVKLLEQTDSETNTPLHYAAQFGHNDIVKLILSVSLSTLEWKHSGYMTPLSWAAFNGHKETVEILLGHGAQIDSEDAVPALLNACSQGHADVFEFLLNKGAQLGSLDIKGRNCMEAAIDENKKNIALIIAKHKNWKEVMKHTRETPLFKRSTPLRELIIKMPDVAVAVLNNCISETADQSGEHSVTYDYELLDDIYSDWSKVEHRQEERKDVQPFEKFAVQKKSIDKRSSFDENGRLRKEAKLYSTNREDIKKNHSIMLMVARDNEELLGHPLVKSLIDHKWTSYVQYLYYYGLMLYILFLSFLTDFAVNSPPHYNYPKEFQTLPTDFCNNETMLTIIQVENISTVSKRVRISQYLALILAVLNILKELSQWYYRGREYLAFQNIIEATLYTCTLVFLIDWNSCSRFYGYRMPKQWLVGVAGTLLAWINLILMVRQFPLLGLYVVMFTDVLRTFTKFFVVLFLLIVAFALAFFMLFQNQAPFTNLPRTIVKTLVMMVGEFEYNSMFYSTDPDHDDKAYEPAPSQIMFFVFALVMTIVMANLLVGLAVQDIKEVQNKAILNRLAMKAELVLEIEYIAAEFFRRKFMIGQKTVTDDEKGSFILKRLFRWLFQKSKTETTSDAIANLYGENEKPDSKKLAEINNIYEQICQLKQNVTELKSKQDNIRKILTAIADRFDVNVLADKPE